jgi:GNAT superfamily N-acetyltransferase
MNLNKQDYIFSQATENDVPLALIFRRLLFDEMGVPDKSLIDNSYDILREIYAKEYREGRIAHFIARDSGNIPVAIAGALLKTDFPYFLFKPGYYGWIIDVYTAPEHRGRNLAARLHEMTRRWLVGKGVTEAKLIASGGDARRLYQRLGYRPTWEMSLSLSGLKTYNEIIDIRGHGEGI